MIGFSQLMAADCHARANPNLDEHTLELTRDARAYYAQSAVMFEAIAAELSKAQ